jgi:regulatory protein YycI of two-component signal transduction system YycFG
MTKKKYIIIYLHILLIISIFAIIFFNWTKLAQMYTKPLNNNMNQQNLNNINILPAP